MMKILNKAISYNHGSPAGGKFGKFIWEDNGVNVIDFCAIQNELSCREFIHSLVYLLHDFLFIKEEQRTLKSFIGILDLGYVLNMEDYGQFVNAIEENGEIYLNLYTDKELPILDKLRVAGFDYSQLISNDEINENLRFFNDELYPEGKSIGAFKFKPEIIIAQLIPLFEENMIDYNYAPSFCDDDAYNTLLSKVNDLKSYAVEKNSLEKKNKDIVYKNQVELFDISVDINLLASYMTSFTRYARQRKSHVPSVISVYDSLTYIDNNVVDTSPLYNAYEIYQCYLIWDGSRKLILNFIKDDLSLGYPSGKISYLEFFEKVINIIYDFLFIPEEKKLLKNYIQELFIQSYGNKGELKIFSWINNPNENWLGYYYGGGSTPTENEYVKQSDEKGSIRFDWDNEKYIGHDESLKIFDEMLISEKSDATKYSYEEFIKKVIPAFEKYQINPNYDPRTFYNVHYQELLRKANKIRKYAEDKKWLTPVTQKFKSYLPENLKEVNNN